MEGKQQTSFTITIEGMEMPGDVSARISDALQRAVLTEIAAVDFRGNELVFRPIMAKMLADSDDGGGGGGGGAHLVFKPQSA